MFVYRVLNPSSFSLESGLSWKPFAPIIRSGFKLIIFSKFGGILPDEIIAIFLKAGLDFNKDDPGIPTRDFESILFTRSALKDVRATILYLLFAFKFSLEFTLWVNWLQRININEILKILKVKI